MILITAHLLIYGENKLRRLQEIVFNDPHFVGFNYYGSTYKIFLNFEETEDYVQLFEDMAFKLSMGAHREASFTILALVKGDHHHFTFNLGYSEYLNQSTLFPGTSNL